MVFEDSYDEIFGEKKKVMVVMAHPDDTEIYCGGTVAKLLGDGKEVRVIKMTYGDKGCKEEKISSDELRKIREREDKKAMQVLGIKDSNNIYLGYGDGEVVADLEAIEKLALQIRTFKPDLLITHNPEDVIIRFDKDVNWVNHRDHRNTGIAAIDAAYPYSRDILFFPDQLKKSGVDSHGVCEFLLVDYYSGPDVVHIDVTDNIVERIEAIASHESQYSMEHAKDSTDFFTKNETNRRFERFRYVVAD